MEAAALPVPTRETGPDAAPPPPWADMDTDCLAHVFRRLDLEDLAAAAPLVCRGWRRAAADPSLWRALDLRRDHVARFMPWAPLAAAFTRRYGVTRFAVAGFLRVCVARAQGSADDVALPPLLASPAADLDHISVQYVACAPHRSLFSVKLNARGRMNTCKFLIPFLQPVVARACCRCPRLRRLALPQLPAGDEARLPDLIPRWPLLEHLELDAKPSTTFPALAEQLGRHCPNFASLKTSGAVKPEDATALARSLPRLRNLRLDRSYVPKQELLAILAGCQDLRELTPGAASGSTRATRRWPGATPGSSALTSQGPG
jgi:hypothetical protein